MYIAIKHDDTVYKSDSLIEMMLSLFTIDVSDKGIATINGMRDTISYNMEEFTHDEAVRDFCRSRCLKLSRSLGYIIFKAEQLN